MLDLKFMQRQPDVIREALKARGVDLDFDHFLTLDVKRKDIVQQVEDLRHERNQASAEVAELKKAGQDASSHISRLSVVAERIKDLDVQRKEIEQDMDALRLSIPNIPHPDVPVGATDEDNLEVKTWGTPRPLIFRPRPTGTWGHSLGVWISSARPRSPAAVSPWPGAGPPAWNGP